MKRVTLLTIIFLVWILTFPNIYSQIKGNPDFYKLPILPGKVETYYSLESETRAKYLQLLIEDAVIFFQNKLGDTIDVKLVVLNRKDYKSMVGGFYLSHSFDKDPYRIETGITELLKMKLDDNKTLYGKNEIFLWDLISVHELGHYISQTHDIKALRWMSEFFADYVMIGYIIEKIPGWQFPSRLSNFYKYLPFKYKTLEDFQSKYSNIGPLNYYMYQVKYEELAYAIFKNKGWDFMFEYLDKFGAISRDDSIKLAKLSLSEKVDFSLSEFKKMEPGIFDNWIKGMGKSYHSLVIFLILIASISVIRFLDNSYNIFNRLSLQTNKKYRIFGIPARIIISNLTTIENLKIKRKLKLIIGLRPLMYLCILLLVFLLIIHH